MVSVLTIGEIVCRQIRARHDDLVVYAVQLHMLQAPALIDTLRDVLLSQPGQVGCVVHADFYAGGTKFCD